LKRLDLLFSGHVGRAPLKSRKKPARIVSLQQLLLAARISEEYMEKRG